MNGFLQRLFDRGAASALAQPGVPGGEVAPAMAPGSPAFAFDQRLAEPGLARFFGILGLSPDAHALPEAEAGASGAAAAAALVAEPAAALPFSSAKPPPRRAADAGGTEGVHPGAPMRGVRSTTRAVPPANHVSPTPLAAGPHGTTVRATRAEGEPATVEPRPVPEQPPLAAVPAEPAPAIRSTEAPAAVTVISRRAESGTITPALPRPTQDRAVPPMPADMAVPTASLPPVHPLAPPRARALPPEVEPLRRAPAPVEAPSASVVDAREVERIARAAVRAELARRPAAGGPPEQRRGNAATSARESERKSSPRPATAREASVIGELEPSSSPLTIYGLRRR